MKSSTAPGCPPATPHDAGRAGCRRWPISAGGRGSAGTRGGRRRLDTTPRGAITGFGPGPASPNDRLLADTCFAVRATPDPHLPSVGQPVSDRDVADMGGSGREAEARWHRAYGACVVCPPQSDRHRAWPKPLRRWLAGLREVVATVTDRLRETFRLEHERPHARDGRLARLAAKVGLPNVCRWFNRQRGRPDLAFADLIDWEEVAHFTPSVEVAALRRRSWLKTG